MFIEKSRKLTALNTRSFCCTHCKKDIHLVLMLTRNLEYVKEVANHSIKTAQNIEEAFKTSHTQINTPEDPSDANPDRQYWLNI